MRKRTLWVIRSLVVTAVLAVPLYGQDDESLKKDLTAVIALHGLPCGEVVSVNVRAENDYDASCKDGNRYHVYVNTEGRVMVDPEK
jgi:hypothetical protein